MVSPSQQWADIGLHSQEPRVEGSILNISLLPTGTCNPQGRLFWPVSPFGPASPLL